MKGFDPDATIRIDGHEPIPVSNVETHRAENVPAYRRPLVGWPALYGRHWLTGQPLEGVYLREVKRPLLVPKELTLSMEPDTESVMASLKQYLDALESVGAKSHLFGEKEAQ